MTEPELSKKDEIIYHLLELRSRLLKAFGLVLIVFLVLAPFSNKIYTLVASPMLESLNSVTGTSGTMLAIKIASPILAPLKLTLFVAFYLTIPWVFYQVWAFVAPALYKKEKRVIFPLIFSSVILFYIGALFAFFVIFPITFKFLQLFSPEGVQFAPDISEYLSFVLTLVFAFGVAFETPVATILLVITGVVSIEKLKKMRPYVVLLVFTIGMLLTPPDIISQSLLAIPMWFLYEIGLFFAQYVKKNKPEDSVEEN